MTRLRQRGVLGLLRSCAAVGVLLLASGYASGLVHDLTAHHTRCAEHGELVDGADAQRDAAPAAASGDAASVARPAAAAGPERHDHCAAAALRSAARPQPGLAAASPHLSKALPPAPRAVPAVVAIALLRLAPKASPPSSELL